MRPEQCMYPRSSGLDSNETIIHSVLDELKSFVPRVWRWAPEESAEMGGYQKGLVSFLVSS
jgi:hypothetical protein